MKISGRDLLGLSLAFCFCYVLFSWSGAVKSTYGPTNEKRTKFSRLSGKYLRLHQAHRLLESRSTQSTTKPCCRALKASCMACFFNVPIEKFCVKHAETAGCKIVTGNKTHNTTTKPQSTTAIENSEPIFTPQKKSLDDFVQHCDRLSGGCHCQSDIKKDATVYFGVRPSSLCPGEIKSIQHDLSKGKYAYVSLFVGARTGGRGADACDEIQMCNGDAVYSEPPLVTLLKVLKHTLAMTNTPYPFVVMYPEGTDDKEIQPLRDVGIVMREVRMVTSPTVDSGEKMFHKQSYTKLATFTLTEYDKVVYLDADMVVSKNIDFLFESETPAFTVQTSIHFSAKGDGYDDRKSAPMHAGLMVITPDEREYRKMTRKIPQIKSFDGGDTGFMWSYLPMYYELPAEIVKGKWDQAKKKIGSNSYVLHFIGNKPLTCGRAMDCNQDIDNDKVKSAMEVFYAPQFHYLWWAWHDHMQVMDKRNNRVCNAAVVKEINRKLNRINYCFDAAGNVGSVVQLVCNGPNYKLVQLPHIEYLKGTCSESKADGPTRLELCKFLGSLFAQKDGKPFMIDCTKEQVVIPNENVAAFIFRKSIAKPNAEEDFRGLPIMFWWETEKGKTVSEATSRIMHAAIKSASLHGDQQSPVFVFSNSLDPHFFCQKSTLKGWEREHALPFTCRAKVLKYSVDEMLETMPVALKDVKALMGKIQEASGDAKGYMHTMSDVIRFLMLYRHGGTYMDFDQLFIRPLPAERPLISREHQWAAADCSKKTEIATTAYCTEIGKNAVPGRFGNPPLPNDDGGIVFSLFSGLLAEFPKRSPYIKKIINMIAGEYKQYCWGCLGPNLVTKSFSQYSKQFNEAPAYTRSSGSLLMMKHGWRKQAFSEAEFKKNTGAVIDVDFHTSKSPDSMLAELVSRTLFASPKRNHKSLLDLVNEEEYQRLKKANHNTTVAIESKEFAKLPWLKDIK